MRDSCIFYRSFYEALKELPPETRAVLYDAIFEYSLNGIEIDLQGIEVTVFRLIKPQLDANNKRFMNGKQPKNKQNGSKTEAKDKQNRSEIEANNNNNNNLNENVNVNENKNIEAVEIKTDNDTKTFIDKVLKRYGIIEGNNQRAYMDNYSMVARYMAGDLKTDEDILYFRKQISFYFNYKDKSGEKLHSLPKLITEAWKQCNWYEKAKEVISTPQNGKSNGQNTKMPIGHIYTDPNYVPAVTWGLGENKT